LSIGDNLKGKNLIVVAAAAIVLFIVVVVVFFPAPKDNSGGEVISKRMKVNIQDEGPDTTAVNDTKPAASSIKELVKDTAPAMGVENAAQKPAEQPIKIAIAEQPATKPVKEPEKQAAEAVKKAVKTPAKTVEHRTPRKAATTAKVASKTTHSRGTWALNVASFSNLPDAKKLRERLKTSGYNSYITEFTKDSVRWYRVRVGFYATRPQAESIGKRIKQKFRVQTPWVVRPPKEEVSAYAG